MSRKSTPDILGEIMGGTPSPNSNIAVKPESNKAVGKESLQASLGESSKTCKKQSNKAIINEIPLTMERGSLSPSSEETHIAGEDESSKAIKPEELKEKATFNLSIEVLDELETVWMKLRRQRKDKRITKTLIVETALKKVLGDFFDREKGSWLFRDI